MIKEDMINVLILGTGSFGTALSYICNVPKVNVTVWGNDRNVLKEIEFEKTNRQYIEDLILPNDINVAYDLENTCSKMDIIFFAVPSQAVREVAVKIRPYIKSDALIVNFAKGLELKSHYRLSEVLKQELPEHTIIVASGPSHAEELAKRYPTSMVSASDNIEDANYIRDIFSSQYLKFYSSNDVLGVELGGIVKNIIALAAGISDGLGFHSNTKAFLITKGLKEMSQIGERLGAQASTFQSLSGIGDLVVTATSTLSRNWNFGYKIGSGKKFTEALSEMSMVVEGIHSTKAVYELAEEHSIYLPITDAVYNILYAEKPPEELIVNLMKHHNI